MSKRVRGWKAFRLKWYMLLAVLFGRIYANDGEGMVRFGWCNWRRFQAQSFR